MVDICIFKYNLQERKETIVIIEWVLRNIYSNILTPPPPYYYTVTQSLSPPYSRDTVGSYFNRSRPIDASRFDVITHIVVPLMVIHEIDSF